MDKTNYFTVEVYGAQARACSQYLGKGSRVVVEAEPDWREWTDQQGAKREAVTFRARQVLFEGGARAAATSEDSQRNGASARRPAGRRGRLLSRRSRWRRGQRRRPPVLRGPGRWATCARTTLLAWPYPGR